MARNQTSVVLPGPKTNFLPHLPVAVASRKCNGYTFFFFFGVMTKKWKFTILYFNFDTTAKITSL